MVCEPGLKPNEVRAMRELQQHGWAPGMDARSLDAVVSGTGSWRPLQRTYEQPGVSDVPPSTYSPENRRREDPKMQLPGRTVPAGGYFV